jgi:aspartyl-tRNA(Asn)/glutamyl-tRNA(Gln) amidotransferase subunit A
MPIGMQIAGAPFDESTILRTAHAYEQDARWFEQRPAM